MTARPPHRDGRIRLAFGALLVACALPSAARAPLPAPNVTMDWPGQVSTMDVAPDGGYIIGGEFRKVFVTPRANLAKITAAGALVTSFDPSAIMSGANNTTGIGIVEVHKGQQ